MDNFTKLEFKFYVLQNQVSILYNDKGAQSKVRNLLLAKTVFVGFTKLIPIYLKANWFIKNVISSTSHNKNSVFPKLQNHLFSVIYFCFMPNLFKQFKKCQHYEDTIFSLNEVWPQVIQGHLRPLLCQNDFRSFVYGPFLMRIYMNANIMRTQFFIKFYLTWNVIFKLWRSFVIFYFKAF